MRQSMAPTYLWWVPLASVSTAATSFHLHLLIPPGLMGDAIVAVATTLCVHLAADGVPF